jgi:alkanesulfonate monooxygenase SsuD/methylene tetrahydromethanopterin reductase-like flavin-dependent oxidoreductase (luciferase family)
MKYALYLPNFSYYSDLRRTAALAREAEDAGWDGFFVWDDVTGYPGIVDPWILLAAVAMSTTRLRIGALITPLARRRPWKVARETVSLDHLSNGRMVFGVGTGGGHEEYGDLGEEADPKQRGAMLDEGLEVLTGLWSGEAYHHEGQFYHVKAAPFTPKPLQQPRIPIWVGGVWPHKAPLRRMARWDGMFPLLNETSLPMEQELPRLRQAVEIVRGLRSSEAPLDVIVTGMTDGTREQAAEKTAAYAASGATWWLESIAPFVTWAPDEKPRPFEAIHERIMQGPPAS